MSDYINIDVDGARNTFCVFVPTDLKINDDIIYTHERTYNFPVSTVRITKT